jgi:cysteine desulfurase
MAVYLDCAATTPVDPRVQEEVVRHLSTEFGNAGSRTHDYGLRARQAVEKARDQVAALGGASRGNVIFTSGATESNNLAILGLAEHGEKTGRRHIVSTRIEHRAVLEPLQALSRRGFAVTLVPPEPGGWVDPDAIRRALRPDTLLVSVMHVNNETGVIQPLPEIGRLLDDSAAYFHVDAAQGFGKELASLRDPRIDLISASGHKLCAPKGIGTLIVRRRGGVRPPLSPLMFGGGQEKGLRPGTLPVHLIVGLGKAAQLAADEAGQRAVFARAYRDRLLAELEPLGAVVNSDLERTLPYFLNLSLPGLDSETVMEAWRELVAVSDGAACTSQSYTCSHVLSAMGLSPERMEGAIRLSWCHLTEAPDTAAMVTGLTPLRVLT